MKVDYKKEQHRYQYYFLKAKSLYQQPNFKASANLFLTLAVISFFVLFAIKPTLETIGKLNKELKEKRKINQTFEQKITALNKVQTNYGQIIDDLSFVSQSLPEEVEFNQIASRINFLVFSHNLVLSSASFEGFNLVSPDFEIIEVEGEGPKANSIGFNISVTGSFSDVKAFLNDLEKMDRLLGIESLAFSRGTGTEATKIEMNLNSKVFWLSRAVKQMQPEEGK